MALNGSMGSSDNTTILAHARALAAHYDVWLCDIWGVLHNGIDAFPSASHACEAFRDAGGTVVLISNSPRPGTGVIPQMRSIGVPDTAWDAVVTSGDITRGFISRWEGQPVYHLGPDRDHGLFDGLDVSLAPLEHAAVVVNTGLFDDETETPDDYRTMCDAMLTRDLTMICANPDKQVERGDRLIYCAGALADLYEEMGGSVLVGGKPHPPIYETAIAQASTLRQAAVDQKRVLAIGDSIRTDMTGAHNAGLDALFIASALHVNKDQELDDTNLVAIFEKHSFSPVAAQTRLTW